MNALEMCLADLPPEAVEVEDPAEVERGRVAKLHSYRMGVRLLLWAHTIGAADHWATVALREAMKRHELIFDPVADFYFEMPDAVAVGMGEWTARDAARLLAKEAA